MSWWVISFATIVAAILIHRLLKLTTRSSLRLPPGPRPWPIVGNLPHMGPAPHKTLADMAHTYGPLLYLRLGSIDTVVAASASVAEQFLKVHDANFSSRPLKFMPKYMAYNKEDFAFAPYGPRWRLLRKISSVHMFSGKAMDDSRQLREDEVERLMNNLASSDSKAVKLGQLVNICTTNAMSRVMIGQRVFNDDSSSYDSSANEFKLMVAELMVLLGVFNIGDFIPALDWLDFQGVKARAKKLLKRTDAFLTTILEEYKISKKEKQKNLYLSTLLSLKETSQEGYKLTEEEIKSILLNMFAAGTDTSSSTVEWAIAELIRNPLNMIQVQQELDTVVGRDRLVTELDLPQLPYLQAVVKETFRLHPPTPLSLPRVAEESCEIYGYHIPKGATLLVNVWAIARDPKKWPNPLEFKPERFLPGGEKADVDVKGMTLRLYPLVLDEEYVLMIQLLIASLVHAFDWKLENEFDLKNLNMDEAYGIALQKAIPLSIHPHPRLSRNIYSSSFSM
ncbi:Flavonoid 3'-monooxygenase, partial [Mucuna pruriens]